MQTWSFASQSSNDSLLSAVPAVLALLLKTLSNILEFSAPGLRLCRTLLQKRQLELIARGITANKTKDFVISPALRLLREVTIFDGGASAKQVYRTRDYTLKGLGRNLGLRNVGDMAEERKKPSVRTNALRFVLALLKFMPVEAKKEVLNQRDVVAGITREINHDPAFLVLEVLETLRTHVLGDDNLPRDAKAKILNASSLGRLVTLYGYEHVLEEEDASKKTVDVVVHEFLMLACTTPELGVMNRQGGFYPRGVDPDDGGAIAAGDADFIDLGLDSIEWFDKFTDKVPVRNTILSDFIQTLRPWSSTKQSELLLAILRAAPELMADYFFGKKSFTFDPKLTATWIGYSAVLFSAVQMPVPQYLGHKDRFARLPPPVALVIESILPQPLNQKALTRCLNQKSPLITFFAVRILTMAFKKLQDTLVMFRQAASEGSVLWEEAATRLVEEFCKRCPKMKDVIVTFKSMTEKDYMQREAVTRLLVMYYESVPQLALNEKFDISVALTEALHDTDDSDVSPEDIAMRTIILEHLFQIAHRSPGMRWFNKPERLECSPFVAMLKLSVNSSSETPMLGLRSILDSVVHESQVLQEQTKQVALDALIVSLRALAQEDKLSAIYTFLDDCILRSATKPIKYYEQLEDLQSEAHGAKANSTDKRQKPLSLLVLAIAEQWPFVLKAAPEDESVAVAHFIAHLIAALTKISEDKKMLKVLKTQLLEKTPETSPCYKIIDRSRKLVDTFDIPEKATTATRETVSVTKTTALTDAQRAEILEEMLEKAPHNDNAALLRWTSKTVDEVIEDGHAAALIMLLSSPELGVRKEALTNIAKLSMKIKESSYEEREQIWLLLCEVAETARTRIDTAPLATIISAFASRAVAVLTDPLHCLYPKLNKFLSQGPTWDAEKIPLMHNVLHESPSHDDAHYREIDWLLTTMLLGLRSEADMAIFHKRRVFEKLLALYGSAYVGRNIQTKILKLLFKATAVEGGSTTLITRFSGLSWAQAQVALRQGVEVKVLMERILATSDETRVGKWTGARAVEVVQETVNM